MRDLLYRLPRFKSELPMDFIIGDVVRLGVCVDISESGLRGTLSNPLPAGSKGVVTLYHGDHSVQVHARVESMLADEARIHFYFAADSERENLVAFLKLLYPGSPKRF